MDLNKTNKQTNTHTCYSSRAVRPLRRPSWAELPARFCNSCLNTLAGGWLSVTALSGPRSPTTLSSCEFRVQWDRPKEAAPMELRLATLEGRTSAPLRRLCGIRKRAALRRDSAIWRRWCGCILAPGGYPWSFSTVKRDATRIYTGGLFPWTPKTFAPILWAFTSGPTSGLVGIRSRSPVPICRSQKMATCLNMSLQQIPARAIQRATQQRRRRLQSTSQRWRVGLHAHFRAPRWPMASPPRLQSGVVALWCAPKGSDSSAAGTLCGVSAANRGLLRPVLDTFT